MADYIPNTDDALAPWLLNLKTKLTPAYLTTLSIDPTRATQITAWIDDLTAALKNVGDKKADWLAAAAAKQA